MGVAFGWGHGTCLASVRQIVRRSPASILLTMPQHSPPITLVLLPGMDGSGTLFAPFIMALGNAFNTVVVRYPPDRAWDYSACLALARQAIPPSGQCVIIGESFSGPVAIALAAERPKGLVALVLCATFASTPHAIFRPFANWTRWLPMKAAPLSAAGFALLGPFATPDLLAALGAALANVSTASLQARLRAVLSVDVRHLLRQVTVPILYLRARQDLVVPARAAREILALNHHVQVVDIEAPHFLLQAVPRPAANALLDFLRAL